MSKLRFIFSAGAAAEPERTVDVELPVPLEPDDGQSVQQIALSHGIRIGGACGGLGRCTTCRVKLMDADGNPNNSLGGRFTREEKDFYERGILSPDYRLACQAVPQSEMTVWIDT